MALTALTKWRNLLRHYARLRSSLLRTTAGTRVHCRRDLSLRGMTTVSLLRYWPPLLVRPNRDFASSTLYSDYKCLVYSFAALPSRRLVISFLGENGRFIKPAFFLLHVPISSSLLQGAYINSRDFRCWRRGSLREI